MGSAVDEALNLDTITVSGRETGVRLTGCCAGSVTLTTLLSEASRERKFNGEGDGGKGGELHLEKCLSQDVRSGERKQWSNSEFRFW